jgi:hypothetical protein
MDPGAAFSPMIFTRRVAPSRLGRNLRNDREASEMNDVDYLALQVGIVCTLLFAVALTAVVVHPEWFG